MTKHLAEVLRMVKIFYNLGVRSSAWEVSISAKSRVISQVHRPGGGGSLGSIFAGYVPLTF